LYVVIETHIAANGGRDIIYREGEEYLGSALPAASEPYVIAAGSSKAAISAARVAAGLPPSSGD
jgi:hypothetical protein